MTNKYLEKIASWADHPVRAAKGIAKAWKETPGPARLSMGLSGASLGVGTLNYQSSQRRAKNQEGSKELEHKSLNVLKDIHKTLEQSAVPTQEKKAAEKPKWVDHNPDIAESTRNLAVAGSGGAAITGVGLAGSAYHRGDLTGRETLYHGSSESNIDRIRKEGLKPNKRGGISGIANLDKHNENLVFTTKNKHEARQYAWQQSGIEAGTIHDVESLGAERKKIMMGVPGKYNSNKYIAKINLPTWKKEYKPVWNPEVRHQLREADKPFAFMHRAPGMSVKEHKRQIYKQFQKSVHVNRGEHGIGPEYVKGSPHYTPNSIKEIGEYAKHNKGRFAKGLGKAVGGAAMAVGGAVGAVEAIRKLTPKDD